MTMPFFHNVKSIPWSSCRGLLALFILRIDRYQTFTKRSCNWPCTLWVWGV